MVAFNHGARTMISVLNMLPGFRSGEEVTLREMITVALALKDNEALEEKIKFRRDSTDDPWVKWRGVEKATAN